MRSRQIFAPLEEFDFAKYNDGKHRWIFKNGSILQFAHCEHESDVTDYQSQQIDLLIFDESTQFTRFIVRYLLTRNRATVDGITPFCIMATNPGNVGHGWHKQEFIDPGIIGKPFDVEVEPGRWERHYFLPARLSDNKILEERDPGYRRNLENQDEDTRRALLEGDWDVFAGQYFKSFRKEKHTCEEFPIPQNWRRFISIDWGYSAPCAVLWHTLEPDTGRIYTYRELYISETDASDVARLIVEMSGSEEIAYAKASPDMWQERGLGRNIMGGQTIAETFQAVWDKEKFYTPLERADNRRIMGWMRMREYMKDAPDGKPYWIIFKSCTNLIRTLPEMVHDPRNVEDIDDNSEDHACLVGNTLVTTNKGQVPIKDIKPGDLVLTRQGYKRVLHAWVSGTKPVYRLTTKEGYELVGTGDHPVWVKKRGFTRLDALRHGDRLKVAEGAAHVLSLSLVGIATVHDIEVEEAHEFYANGILVKNCEAARYFLMSRPSPSEGVSFLAGGFPGRLRVRTVEDDDDDLDLSERIPTFFSY